VLSCAGLRIGVRIVRIVSVVGKIRATSSLASRFLFMVMTMAIAGVVWIVIASVRRWLERRRWNAPALSKAELVRRGWTDEQ
jgi:hypothetical protein